jgi:hypothetical protein
MTSYRKLAEEAVANMAELRAEVAKLAERYGNRPRARTRPSPVACSASPRTR